MRPPSIHKADHDQPAPIDAACVLGLMLIPSPRIFSVGNDDKSCHCEGTDNDVHQMQVDPISGNVMLGRKEVLKVEAMIPQYSFSPGNPVMAVPQMGMGGNVGWGQMAQMAQMPQMAQMMMMGTGMPGRVHMNQQILPHPQMVMGMQQIPPPAGARMVAAPPPGSGRYLTDMAEMFNLWKIEAAMNKKELIQELRRLH